MCRCGIRRYQGNFLGDEKFVARMCALAEPQRATSREVPRAQRRQTQRSIKHYLAHGIQRDHAILAAYREGQHTRTDIATTLGLSISRISRIIRQSEDGT